MIEDAVIHVISFPHREDRRGHITRELERVGISDWSFVQPEPLKGSRGGWKNKAVRSCFETHMHIAQNHFRVARDVPFIVFEDDARFETGWDAASVDRAAQLFEWDMITFGWLKADGEGPLGAELGGGWAGGFTGETVGGHAYAVSPNGLSRWIYHLQRIYTQQFHDDVFRPMAIDGAANTISWADRSWNRVVAVPSLVGQISSASDISPKLWDRFSVTRRAAGWVRQSR